MKKQQQNDGDGGVRRAVVLVWTVLVAALSVVAVVNPTPATQAVLSVLVPTYGVVLAAFLNSKAK